MSNKIIDVKEIMQGIRNEVKSEVETLNDDIKLVVVQVGDNPASNVYIRNKQRMCDEVGIKSELLKFDESITQDELDNEIQRLNYSKDVTGILVQLPLPSHLDEKKVAEVIDWRKDVDAFHPILQGKLMRNEDLDIVPIPCTPFGILKILEAENTELDGARVCVVGRSNIVGKPISMLLQHKNATVTMAHSRTKRLATETKRADIVVVAIGRANMLGANYFTGGQTLIDVGINRLDTGKLAGDINLESVLSVRDDVDITPVPGGCGIATVTMLLVNTLRCYKLQQQ